MKKIELLNKETFTIKGTYGETYVFDGSDLFVQGPLVKKAVVLKSLRTQKGAEEWLKVAGKNYDNARVVNTSTLKAFDGEIVKADDEEEKPFDSPLPFHVVSMENEEMEMPSGDEEEEGEESEVEMEEMNPGDIEDDEVQEQEMSVTQIAQVLHDAQKLHELLTSGKHLEPWMQSKLVKVAEYMNALTENLEHRGGEIPGMDMGSSEKSEMEDPAMKSDDGDAEEKGEKKMPPFIKEKMDESKEKDSGEDKDEEDSEKAVDAEEGEDESDDKEDKEMDGAVKGKIFKSLHAARQWNRFENPDKDRYYIDILREKDMVGVTRKSFTKSTGLNAKYIVRDRADDEKVETKGAFGNKLKKN
jgi:hypothetical protein